MKKPKILCLFGLSGSSKSTMERMLANRKGFKKVVSSATRKIRDGEKHGVDYYYITEQEFDENIEKGLFAEVGGKYGGRYGVLYSEILDDEINILVTAKDGMEELKELEKYDMINIWLDCDVCERFLRISKRNNLEYSLSRIEKDGFRREQEADLAHYVIDTTNLTEDQTLDLILEFLRLEGWIEK